MEYIELAADVDTLSRVDLSFNGVDMGCAYGDLGLFGPRCEDAPAAVYYCAGFLWPAGNSHKAGMEYALRLAPDALAFGME